jgi:hypothetical protein
MSGGCSPRRRRSYAASTDSVSMRRSRPDRTTTSHASRVWRLAHNIRVTSFDEPSAETACFLVSASGRIPSNETRREGGDVFMLGCRGGTFSIEERLVKAADLSSGQNRREIFIRALFTHESRKEVLLVGSNMAFRRIGQSIPSPPLSRTRFTTPPASASMPPIHATFAPLQGPRGISATPRATISGSLRGIRGLHRQSRDRERLLATRALHGVAKPFVGDCLLEISVMSPRWTASALPRPPPGRRGAVSSKVTFYFGIPGVTLSSGEFGLAPAEFTALTT